MKLIPIIELIRLEENYQYGTFGVLKINKKVFCVTLEPADNVNTRYISSIPAQQYICKKTLSSRYGEVFKIMDVPNRNNVLIHSGNTIVNTQGCPILAQYYGKLKGDRAVLNSGKTFKAFMHMFADVDELHLTIKECY